MYVLWLERDEHVVICMGKNYTTLTNVDAQKELIKEIDKTYTVFKLLKFSPLTHNLMSFTKYQAI